MFSKIINWIKTNKIISALIVVILFLLLRGSASSVSTRQYSGVDSIAMESAAPSLSMSKNSTGSVSVPTSQNRKVVTNSNFSLLVKKVNETIDSVKTEAEQMSGYVVSTVINRDEKADTADIEVRVPSAKLVEFSKYLRSISVKVVYENVIGYDITDQYTDYTTRLTSLQSAKAKLETIMNSAYTADDILNIQTKIFEIQDQIDAVKGQIAYMDKASSTSKVSISISTDEMSLPYTPVKTWRPDIVFKQAIRALVSTLMSVGTAGIWIVVFSPLLLLVIIIKKIFFKKKQ